MREAVKEVAILEVTAPMSTSRRGALMGAHCHRLVRRDSASVGGGDRQGAGLRPSEGHCRELPICDVKSAA